MTDTKENKIVKCVKYFTEHYHHIYKNYEALIFFILSALYLSYFTNLKSSILQLTYKPFDTKESIKLNYLDIICAILSNWALWIILICGVISWKLSRKVTQEIELLKSDNSTYHQKLKESQSVISDLKNSLDVAEEAIDDLKQNHVKKTYNYNSKLLCFVFNQLQLTSNDRISLYLHKTSHFVLAARYSSNSDFHSNHRSQFPDNQGVIGKSWTIDQPLKESFSENEEEYTQQNLDQGFTKQIIRKLTMKSKLLVAVPIKKNSFDKHGVLLIESTNTNGLTENIINDVMKYSDVMLHLLSCYEVDLDDCQSTGGENEN